MRERVAAGRDLPVDMLFEGFDLKSPKREQVLKVLRSDSVEVQADIHIEEGIELLIRIGKGIPFVGIPSVELLKRYPIGKVVAGCQLQVRAIGVVGAPIEINAKCAFRCLAFDLRVADSVYREGALKTDLLHQRQDADGIVGAYIASARAWCRDGCVAKTWDRGGGLCRGFRAEGGDLRRRRRRCLLRAEGRNLSALRLLSPEGWNGPCLRLGANGKPRDERSDA